MPTRLTSVVIDANDRHFLARWWAAALEWEITFEDHEDLVIQAPGDPDGFALVIGSVPESKQAKNRVHLDLATESATHQEELVARLVAAGARPADVGQGETPWVVLADPEGNEFCVLEPRDRYIGRGSLAAVVVDVVDAAAAAAFWSFATAWPVVDHGPGWARLAAPSGALVDLDLLEVPEPKTVKNRLHLDVAPYEDEDQDQAVAELLALGARHLDIGQGEQTWVVLADPEGHEFCVLRPQGVRPARTA